MTGAPSWPTTWPLTTHTQWSQCLAGTGAALGAYERAVPPAYEVQARLMRIACSEVIDRQHRRRCRSLLLARFFGGTTEADPRANVESQAVPRDELRRAIGRLSSRDRVLD